MKQTTELMGYLTADELGRLLRVGSDMIEQAHDRGFLAEPHRLGDRRVYDWEGIVRVASYFGRTPDGQTARLNPND